MQAPQLPMSPSREHEKKKPTGLIVLAITTAVARFPPLVILSFLTLYGVASLGPDVPEFERVEPSLVITLGAILVGGVLLVGAEIFMAAKGRLTGLTVVSGLLAIADALALVWLLVESEGPGQFPMIVGFTLAVQVVVTAWAAWAASRSDQAESVAVGGGHVA